MQTSLADPTASNSLLTAMTWLQGTLLGTIAETSAIIAVAGIGLMLLSGRLKVRHGASVILGSFILFGAPLIAEKLVDLTDKKGSHLEVKKPDRLPASITTPVGHPLQFDPYAGASLNR